MGPRQQPLPVVHPDNQEFWDALAHHELRLQRCGACGELRYPVSPVCPGCLSEEHIWERMSGRGWLVTTVTVHRATGDSWWAGRTPFAVALVQLEEGPRLKGGMTAEAAERVAPGDPVAVAFDDFEGATLLRFEPAVASSQ